MTTDEAVVKEIPLTQNFIRMKEVTGISIAAIQKLLN